MNKADVESHLGALYRNQREWDRSMENFVDRTETWESIAKKNMDGIICFYPSEHEAGPIRGSVLTRDFEMHLAPMKVGDRIHIQIVVEVHSTRKTDPVEACRFLINKEGQIVNKAGEILLSDLDESPNLTLLCNLVDHILRADL